MGKNVITIEVLAAQAAGVEAGVAALDAVKAKGLSIESAKAVYHPGESDETSVNLLAS